MSIDVGAAFAVSPAPTVDGAFFAVNLGMTMSNYPTDPTICAGCRLETAGALNQRYCSLSPFRLHALI